MKEIPWLNENLINAIFDELFQVYNNFSESNYEMFLHKKFEVNYQFYSYYIYVMCLVHKDLF